MENRRYFKFIIVTLIMLLCPVVLIKGHYINFVEFYLYLLFFVNIKRIKKNPIASTFILYGMLYIVTIVFTSIISGSVINNHDLYIIRNLVQLVLTIYLMDIYFNETSFDMIKHEKLAIYLFGIFTLPSIIVFLQKFNVFNARELVLNLYQPKFFFLDGSVFAEYRYTSVFKDFYTFAVYSIILNATIFYYFLQGKYRSSQKVILLSFIVINYLSQFFVARTSVVLIPLSLFVVMMFSTPKKILSSAKNIFIFVVFICFTWFVVGEKLLKSEVVNKEWIKQGVGQYITQDNTPNSTSFTVLNKWNSSFYTYVTQNPEVLFVPNHSYDITEQTHPELYSDSFYVQEIYRYGIYGIIIYIMFVILFIKRGREFGRQIPIMVFLFVLLNYKGGNVFFMSKNIYLYGVIFSMLISWSKIKYEEKTSTIINV